MRAQTISDILKKGDRIAVSNITGREASKVSVTSQAYCQNIVGGWALGKAGQSIETPVGPIPVFATFAEMLKQIPQSQHPNKILIYSPPPAVLGEVQAVCEYGRECVETIFVVTEHVSIEDSAKINAICKNAHIDVIGCNTLGFVNAHDSVRIGAVGGDTPKDSFPAGSIAVISNSGNMVNTIAGYVASTGMKISYGISTGKDKLILCSVKDFLGLLDKDPLTKVIVLYVEPGGSYEQDAISFMKQNNFSKPVIVYVAGEIAEKHNVSLGHAGAVVEGKLTSASGKKALFDAYFGIEPFKPEKRYKKNDDELKTGLQRGIRVDTLHDIPKALLLVVDTLGISKDSSTMKPLKLNPWFVNLKQLEKTLPQELYLPEGVIPDAYAEQFTKSKDSFIESMVRQSMKDSSHASANDGATPRIYGYSLMDLMQKHSFAAAIVLYLTGELPIDKFEEKVAEMTLMASLTNGPGTITAQGAKLSASAGNMPNTAMIGTLASMGSVHGGNGAEAVKMLINTFKNTNLTDPYNSDIDIASLAASVADEFKKMKTAAKNAGMEYDKLPCLGHPVFKNDAVNYDPRERVIYTFLQNQGKKNIFLEFYHLLTQSLKKNGCTKIVMAVNVDAAIACIWLGICWRQLREKRMTVKRAIDIPFVAFAIGRVAGGAGEFLDHQDYGTDMDMRVPTSECKVLTRARTLPA